MSEQSKTILFLCIAFVSAIVAFAVSREAPEKTAADLVGESLVAIEDPLRVSRMRIVEFDPSEGRAEPFEVAKVDGLFSIPSHENHPADQSDHLVDAVAGVNHAEILSSVTDQAGNHGDFAVRDPASGGLGRGAEGVGKRVTFSTSNGEPLADFIIGKKVAGTDDQYYVRQASNDHVYTAVLDPASLSTRFEDWIERDVLQFDPLELKQVSISDYTVRTQQQFGLGAEGAGLVTVVEGLDMEAEIQLAYDQAELEWKLQNLIAFEEGRPRKEKLAADQQLNKQRLEGMKEALDDLRVVDVRRKPAGLGDSLAKFIDSSPGAVMSLEEHGFYFRQIDGPGGTVQNVLLSNNGEINIGMANGLQYVLRFGNVAGRAKEDMPAEDAEAKDVSTETTAERDEESTAGRALRNLMVITKFDESLLAVPEYAEVPPEQPPQEESVSDPQAAGSESEGTDEEQVAKEEAQAEEKGAETAEQSQDAEQWRERREAVLTENARKRKAFEEKIAAGKARSAELNRRFSDWYYVIPDATYHKIHLTMKELIEKKPPTEEPSGGVPLPPAGVDPLDQLRNIIPPQNQSEK